MPDLIAQQRANDGSARDVVNDYHQRNRIPRPPDPSSLRDVHLRQQSSAVHNPSGNRTTSEPPVPSQAPSADIPPGPLTGSATKLRSYPHKFREVIERAKQISQCDCALSNPFPSRTDFLDVKSGEHFTEAIAEVQHVPGGQYMLEGPW